MLVVLGGQCSDGVSLVGQKRYRKESWFRLEQTPSEGMTAPERKLQGTGGDGGDSGVQICTGHTSA